jgi:hypothetical protein
MTREQNTYTPLRTREAEYFIRIATRQNLTVEESGFDFCDVQDIFIVSRASRQVFRSIQPPIRLLLGVLGARGSVVG